MESTGLRWAHILPNTCHQVTVGHGKEPMLRWWWLRLVTCVINLPRGPRPMRKSLVEPLECQNTNYSKIALWEGIQLTAYVLAGLGAETVSGISLSVLLPKTPQLLWQLKGAL